MKATVLNQKINGWITQVTKLGTTLTFIVGCTQGYKENTFQQSNSGQNFYQDYSEQDQVRMSPSDYSALTPSLKSALKIDPMEALLDPKGNQDSARTRKLIAENYTKLTGRISADEEDKNAINQKINFVAPAAAATIGALATVGTGGLGTPVLLGVGGILAGGAANSYYENLRKNGHDAIQENSEQYRIQVSLQFKDALRYEMNRMTEEQKEAYSELKKTDPQAANSMMIGILNGRIQSISQAMPTGTTQDMVQNAMIQVVTTEVGTISQMIEQSSKMSKETQEKLNQDLRANKARLEKLEKTTTEGQKQILNQIKEIVSSQIQIQEDLTKMTVMFEKMESVPGSVDFIKRGISFVQFATFNSLNIEDKINALKNDFITFKDLPQSAGQTKEEFIRTLESLRNQIEIQKQLPRLFDGIDQMNQILVRNNMMGKDLADAFSKATQTGRALLGLSQAVKGAQDASKVAGTAGTLAMMASYTNVVTATMTIVALYSGSQTSNQQSEQMNKVIFEIFNQLDGIQKDIKQIHQEIRQISSKLDMLESQITALANQLNYMHQDLVSRISEMGPKLDQLLDAVYTMNKADEQKCLHIYSKKVSEYNSILDQQRKVLNNTSLKTSSSKFIESKSYKLVPYNYSISERTLKTVVLNEKSSYLDCRDYLRGEFVNFSSKSVHRDLDEKNTTIRTRYGIKPGKYNAQNNPKEYAFDEKYYSSLVYYYQQALNQKMQAFRAKDITQYQSFYKQEIFKSLNPVQNMKSVFDKETLLSMQGDELNLPPGFEIYDKLGSIFESIPIGEVLSQRLNPHRVLNLSGLTLQLLPFFEYGEYSFDELSKDQYQRAKVLKSIQENAANYLSGSLTVLNAGVFQESLLSGEVILDYLSSLWNEVQTPDKGDPQCLKPLAGGVFSLYCLVRLNPLLAYNLLSYKLNQYFPTESNKGHLATAKEYKRFYTLNLSTKKSSFPELMNALNISDESGEVLAVISGKTLKLPIPEEVSTKGFILSVSERLEALMELRDRIGLEIANREK